MSCLSAYGIGIAALLLLVASSASADVSATVQDRLNALERKQDEMFQQLESEQGKVQTFLEDRLSPGFTLDFSAGIEF